MKATEKRAVFTKLFTPLKLKARTIHYEFLVGGKNNEEYNVRYTKRKGHMYGPDGRGWLVAKMKSDDWTHLKMTQEERQAVIDFCRVNLV